MSEEVKTEVLTVKSHNQDLFLPRETLTFCQENSLVCCVCSVVPVVNVTFHCEHSLYCQHCVPKSCHHCESQQTKTNKKVHQQIGECKFVCSTCKVDGKVKDLPKHLSECAHRELKCSLCLKRLKIGEWDSHLLKHGSNLEDVKDLFSVFSLYEDAEEEVSNVKEMLKSIPYKVSPMFLRQLRDIRLKHANLLENHLSETSEWERKYHNLMDAYNNEINEKDAEISFLRTKINENEGKRVHAVPKLILTQFSIGNESAVLAPKQKDKFFFRIYNGKTKLTKVQLVLNTVGAYPDELHLGDINPGVVKLVEIEFTASTMEGIHEVCYDLYCNGKWIRSVLLGYVVEK